MTRLEFGPEKTPPRYWVLLLTWGLAFSFSFVLWAVVQPTGSGFTRGLNRLPGFLALQVVAAGIALLLAAWSARHRGELTRFQRLLAWLPLGLAGALVGGILSLVYLAS